MSSELERYVRNIVQQTECNEEEKRDLYEELMVHLQLARDDYTKGRLE